MSRLAGGRPASDSGWKSWSDAWCQPAFHWIGSPTSNDFWAPANWQEGAPPNDGTADIFIDGGKNNPHPISAARDVDIKSLHMTELVTLYLDRSSLTLRNGGQMTVNTRIRQVDFTLGTDVRNIVLAGGTFTWTDGRINDGEIPAQFKVEQGATFHINLGGRNLLLGNQLYNNGGTINIVGGPPAGSTLTFGNGRGLENFAGVVNVTFDVTLARERGGAPNLDNAYIHNYNGSTITLRDGTIISDLPVANGGTFQVLAQTKAIQATIRNASPSTANLGMTQNVGSTRIDANGFNATLSVNEGYQALAGSLVGLASSTAVTPKLASFNGDIALGNSTGAANLVVGDATHINTVFVLAPKTQVTLGDGTRADWYWQKVGGTASYSKAQVQGEVFLSATGTTAWLNTVAGTPANGEKATVLTSTGAFTGDFAESGGEFTGGSWSGEADNPNKKYVFTAMLDPCFTPCGGLLGSSNKENVFTRNVTGPRVPVSLDFALVLEALRPKNPKGLNQAFEAGLL